MAALTVTSNADSGSGSFRNVVASASSGDVVSFDSTVFPAGSITSIPLSSELIFGVAVEVDGDGRVALDGLSATRIATVLAAGVVFRNVKFCNGNGFGQIGNGDGGAVLICSDASATFDSCIFSGSTSFVPVAAPSDVVFAGYDATARTVTMSWTDNSSDETGFRVEYSYNAGATWFLSQTLGANVTSRLCTGVSENKTIFFRVRAYNNISTSAWSYGSFNSNGSGESVNPVVYDTGGLGDAIYSRGSVVFVGDNIFESTTADGCLTDVSIPSGTISGVGYWALPSDSTVPSGISDYVRAVVLGAGLTSFSAVSATSVSATLTWTAADATKAVLIERRTSTGWALVESDAAGTTATVDLPALGVTTYRVWDGTTFLTDVAWYVDNLQYFVNTLIVVSTSTVNQYKIEVRIMPTTEIVRAGQSITILASIVDSFTNNALINTGSNITSIKYSCYEEIKGVYSDNIEREEIPGHINVELPTTRIGETTQTYGSGSSAFEYSLSYSPNITTYPIFPNSGNFVIITTVTLSEGNPIVFEESIEVD